MHSCYDEQLIWASFDLQSDNKNKIWHVVQKNHAGHTFQQSLKSFYVAHASP